MQTAGSASAQEREIVPLRILESLHMDGVLDEGIWQNALAASGFTQQRPDEGQSATERTEVRIAYDEDALYFGFMFFDSEPDRIRRDVLHRGGRIDKDDRVIIGLDTYFDRRNGYIFEVGAPGTQDDALFADESLDRPDWNWDGVFTTETTVNEDGWVLEMEIPFTTIRFADVEEPLMGIAFQRSIRRKNETVIWPHIGQEYRGSIAQSSQYATLTGLKDVRRGHRLEVKPYANLGAQQLNGQDGFEREPKAGLDLKYGLTSNLTLDLTWNTDFAQVETDNVQINLTRFDLFFPEKREFFLERASLFEFGTTQETEVFFSRRIGLEDDILGGGRLTGQAGPISVGALALRTESRVPEVDAGAWNSVVRLQANLHERTTVGAIATSLDASGGASNRVAGADFVTRFWSSSQFRMWGARAWDSEEEGTDEGNSAARAELELQNDRYALRIRRTHVGKAFDPALGFVRRRDQDQWYLWTAFTPRFETSDWARRFWIWAGGERILGTNGELQSRQGGSHVGFEFESGESLSFDLDSRFERLHGPASISGRVLSPGDYRFTSYQLGAKTNDSRVFSGFLSGSTGSFWGGDRSRVLAGVSLKTGPHLTVGGQVSRNNVSLPVPNGDFATTLVAVNVEGAVSRKLFAGAFIQWDNLSKELQANIRVDWIHTPGSDLFLVLDTGYITDDTLDPRLDPWTRRTAVAKLTWLKAF